MDSNDPRRRQSNPPGYASQQGLLQTSPQYPVTSAVDRYRSSQLGTQSPTSAPSTGRGGSVQGYNYGYGENTSFAGSSMNPATLAYQSEYAQEPQRQPHPYGQYGSSLMYNAPQVPTQSPYEPVQQYQQPRQSSAIEVMTNQFAVPQQQYYGASESGPTIAPMSALGSQNNPTQYPQMSYSQQSAAPREQVLSAYGMAEASQSSQATYGQGQPGYSSSELDSAYGQYQAELKKTFASIRDGRMVDAGSSLVSISEWLLGNAETLGLVRDEENMHAERLKLWEQFNTAWLSALTTQIEMTRNTIETGQRPQAPRTLMDTDQMETMGKELVRLCDLMEKHGLVDYQMGVWEEDIISLLSSCLDLLDDNQPQRSASTQRRR